MKLLLNPLVSVIVTTRNNADTLEACLASIAKQTYTPIELIVVDNSSTDQTPDIAKRYTNQFFTHGPERSAQRNHGVSHAKGEYVLIIDSDMELETEVVKACVEKTRTQPNVQAIIIPEESFGQGFWARCKQLERSFYVGVDWMEAARFFNKQAFLEVGGFDTTLVGGEDWDLAYRVGQLGNTARITAFIRHNERNLSLLHSMKKNFYYAAGYDTVYTEKHKDDQTAQKRKSAAARYGLFLSHPLALLRQPIIGGGMLFMKTCELAAGGAGLVKGRGK